MDKNGEGLFKTDQIQPLIDRAWAYHRAKPDRRDGPGTREKGRKGREKSLLEKRCLAREELDCYV
ncbi:MAG: hypothetical protein V1816_00990 [Pseudomonadota bacterium]